MTGPHVVVAGGGTGGHLFPGVAVVEAMQVLDPTVRFTFVGASRGIEATAIPKLGYPLELLDVQPLMSGGILGKIKGVAALSVATLQAMGLHRRLKPDLVLAVGGYAAGPFTAWASVAGTKTALMEQNAKPGFTNRMLSKFVDRAYLSFDSTRQVFPKQDVFVVGNPIRAKLRAMIGSFDYQPYPGEGAFNILVVGGSGGARALNLGVPKALKLLPAELQERIHVTHQAGRGRAEEAAGLYPEFLGDWDVVEFIDDMAEAYASCHLLICRAGMSTIAELTALGIPALYVPLPTGDGHQISNAKEVVNAGGGLMIANGDIGAQVGADTIAQVMRDPCSLALLAAAAKSLGRPDAAIEVAESCLGWLSFGNS